MEAGFAFIYAITHSTRPVVFTSLKKMNKLVTGGSIVISCGPFVAPKSVLIVALCRCSSSENDKKTALMKDTNDYMG